MKSCCPGATTVKQPSLDMPPIEHAPVLRDAAIDALAVQPKGVYLDATYGRGGHSAVILQHLHRDGRLVVLDRDPDAIADAHRRLQHFDNVIVRHADFAKLSDVVTALGLAGRVQGLLFDLGVSSPQLDTAERGFSFMRSGPLDMRMDPGAGVSAAAWLAQASAASISRVLRDYGEEKLHRRIANAIVAARESRPINTTDRLAGVVADAVPAAVAAGQRIHPATRTFQALRIQVNGELDQLRAALVETPALLAPGGRLAVISFHSLEDRIVKRYMREQAHPEPPPVPMAPEPDPLFRLIGKPRRADAAEVAANPRARTAVMRVAERTEAIQ